MRFVVRFLIVIAALSATIAPAVRAIAHGTPIQIEVVNNALSVSGGLADSTGFAPMIFVESTEEGNPLGEVDIPDFGSSIVWEVPGYKIFGMEEHSGLFLDVLSRPVAVSNPVDYRSLWYWKLQTQLVTTTPAANPLQIFKSIDANVTLSPTDSTDPPPLQIAEPVSGDMGAHVHLVAYALKEEVTPPAGAYGFFARLTSNEYAASEPFLVVINNGVFNYSQMVPAARAINAAAFLPGDYNHDDRVDAADYIVWRKTFGSTTTLAADGSGNQAIDQADFGVWRRNVGNTIAGSGVAVNNLPEPQGWPMLVAGIIGFVIVGSRFGARNPSRRPRWKVAG